LWKDLTLTLAALVFLAAAQSAAPAAMPQGDDLVHRIEDADATLFWAAFEGCDPDALENIVGPEFRMLHDLGGLAVPSKKAMIDDARENCAARAPGGSNEGYKNRRQVVPGSRIVRAMSDWGALEEGAHVFFEWNRTDRNWEMVGGARYMHLWKWSPDEGAFHLSQSYSYDHGAAQYPRPARDETDAGE
jgi:hypothetical protein